MTAISPTDLERLLVDRLRAERVKIPSYPAIATKLQAMVGAGRSIEQLAAVAANDPPLVAALVGRAMSAQHARTGTISIAAAIQRVGVDQLVDIAVTASVGAMALAPGPLAALRRDTWWHSLVSARIGQVLSPRNSIPAAEAQLAGLLHDFGAIAVLSAIEEASKETALPTLSEAAWRELVGRLRRSFGEVIAARWKLPAQLAAVISGTGDSPLIRHIALIDHVTDLIDRDALDAIDELTAVECEAIASALPDIVAQMALYSHTAMPKTAESPIERASRPSVSWPTKLEVMHNQVSYLATSIAVAGLELAGRTSLAVNWLVSVVLRCEPTPLQLILNVKACEARDDGTFAIFAVPFGLGGTVRQRWQSLVDQARPA
ncbi:MAG TPA: HDOD domain-containing protein [Kofleriaceae bacterium]|nr:HDOD domain-containing protein [Kofleriaceae bacterium]